MNEESTEEESVRVRWTFDEAAAIAEHLSEDLDLRRCLFMLGGWTEGGYDCRHPDNLPANPECGGNDALADAVRRIQKLGFVSYFLITWDFIRYAREAGIPVGPGRGSAAPIRPGC